MKKYFYLLKQAFIKGLMIAFLVNTVSAFAQPGAPDVTFGKNGRITFIQPGAVPYPPPPFPVVPATPIPVDIKVQPDRKILVLAMIDSIIGMWSSHSNGYQYYLYRLNADGTYDNSFGTNGNTPIVDNQRPVSLELLTNGKILVGSQQGNPNTLSTSGIQFCLSRYNSNGIIEFRWWIMYLDFPVESLPKFYH